MRLFAACLALCLLTGCTSTYSKAQLEPWMQSIESLRADQDLDRLPAARLAALLAPAFCDDVFVPAFGVAYAQLDDDQRDRIRRSLVAHYPSPWVGWGLARPFDDQPANADSRRLWEMHIDRQRGHTFAAVQSARAKAHEQAAVARAEARRRPPPPSVAEMRRRVSSGSPAAGSDVDWHGLGKAVGALVVAEQALDALAEQRNLELDRRLAQSGKVETWLQRTEPKVVQQARKLMPYRLDYDFEGAAIFNLLETHPWNHTTRAMIQRKLDRVLFREPPVSHDEWTNFRDAKRALWLILETPLPQ